MFKAQVIEHPPFVIMWNGRILAVGGALSIVAGMPRYEAALSQIYQRRDE